MIKEESGFKYSLVIVVIVAVVAIVVLLMNNGNNNASVQKNTALLAEETDLAGQAVAISYTKQLSQNENTELSTE